MGRPGKALQAEGAAVQRAERKGVEEWIRGRAGRPVGLEAKSPEER